jgi:hypothetical protein
MSLCRQRPFVQLTMAKRYTRERHRPTGKRSNSDPKGQGRDPMNDPGRQTVGKGTSERDRYAVGQGEDLGVEREVAFYARGSTIPHRYMGHCVRTRSVKGSVANSLKRSRSNRANQACCAL